MTSRPSLGSLTSADLERLFTANSLATVTRLRTIGGAKQVPIPGTHSAYAWASENELHNGVSGVMLSPQDDVEQAVLAVTKGQILPIEACHWVVWPAPQPELEKALVDNGFVIEDDEPAMAAPLDGDENEFMSNYSQALARVGDGFEITPVTDDATLEDWITVWGCGLTPEKELQNWRNTYSAMLREVPDTEFRMFVGRINGRAVGTGITYAAGGVSAVHYIVSLPEYRRRGIGKALTLHSMLIGRQLGYNIAMLTASDDGAGVYRSVGFTEFARNRVYVKSE